MEYASRSITCAIQNEQCSSWRMGFSILYKKYKIHLYSFTFLKNLVEDININFWFSIHYIIQAIITSYHVHKIKYKLSIWLYNVLIKQGQYYQITCKSLNMCIVQQATAISVLKYVSKANKPFIKYLLKLCWISITKDLLLKSLV